MTNDELADMFTSTTVAPKTIYDVHIETLKAIDAELNRLHITLSKQNNGDDDVTQEQISTLVNELVRLSEALGEAEIENEGS